MTEAQKNPLAKNFGTVSLIKFAFPSMVMMLFMGLYTHKRELKQAVLVKLPKGTRHID